MKGIGRHKSAATDTECPIQRKIGSSLYLLIFLFQRGGDAG